VPFITSNLIRYLFNPIFNILLVIACSVAVRIDNRITIANVTNSNSPFYSNRFGLIKIVSLTVGRAINVFKRVISAYKDKYNFYNI
jgi:hypothetical protein